MDNLRWNPRDVETQTVSLIDAETGSAVAVFTEENAGKATAAVVGAATWDVNVDADEAIATLPDGRVFKARGENNQKFGRAKILVGDLSGRIIRFINEQKSDWVVVDNDDQKLAQFTGASHGVRHTELDFEPDADLSHEESIFVAWIARLALENKMLSVTTYVTIGLAALAPFILLVFLL